MEQPLSARYGEPVDLPGASTAVLDLLLAHRSVRGYRPEPLPDGCLERLVAAAQSASTSSNLQTYSIVAVADPERKAAVAAISGNQDLIRQAPVFLCFCADLSRLAFAAERQDTGSEALDYLEMFLMSALDAALAAQNLAVAAESLGLGICYVGGARSQPLALAELLKLPPRVFVVFGLALGWPAEPGIVKGRLPQNEVLHRETYDDAGRPERLAHYDELSRAGYAAQGRAELPGWLHHSAERIAGAAALGPRATLRQTLEALGFPLQ
jgi:nitroreductase